MLKDLGVKPYAFPMPVLLIATYGEDGKVDVMNMAWGGICAENMIALNIDEEHKTSANIKARGAFTVSVADVPHIEAADFFGIASGNKMPDKFARSGLHAVRSEKVDAPVVEEFPLTLECRVAECQHTAYGFRVLGEIVGVLVEEAVLDEKGRVVPYWHHETWHDDNGSSHIKAALLSPFITVPFVNGRITVGPWQNLTLIECDTRDRVRDIVFQVMGE